MIDYIEVSYIVEKPGEEVIVETSVPNEEIKLAHPFTVVEGETLTLTLGFDALKISYRLIFRSWKERQAP